MHTVPGALVGSADAFGQLGDRRQMGQLQPGIPKKIHAM